MAIFCYGRDGRSSIDEFDWGPQNSYRSGLPEECGNLARYWGMWKDDINNWTTQNARPEDPKK